MCDIEISIIMSVYNTRAEYLIEAIDSIESQIYKNWEFIIIDDGSDGYVHDIISSYKDNRIIELRNEHNIGLTRSLNIGLKSARGKFIARMDADDVSYPERLLLQYRYMERHPEVAVVGSWVKMGKRIEKACGRVSTEWRLARMLFDNVGVFHPTAFIRRDFLIQNNLYYDEEIRKSQDYDLWIRVLEKGEMAVYPKVLLNYRIHENQISSLYRQEQRYYNVKARNKLINHLGVKFSKTEQNLFDNINSMSGSPDEVETMFNKIVRANKKYKIMNEKYLEFEITTKWIIFLMQNIDEGRKILKICWKRIVSLRYWTYMVIIAVKKSI